jgi:hypothetical protein
MLSIDGIPPKTDGLGQRGHRSRGSYWLSAEAIAENDARVVFLKNIGYKIIRIRAKDVMSSPEDIKKLLGRLI